MQNLIINEELKNLLPPLSDEELGGLEESILKDRCLTPLILWKGILIDGHHRYAICTKHEIPFSTQSVELGSLDDAKLWIFKHQANRRNLTPFHRSEIALKLKEAVAAKAKERQLAGLKQNATIVPQTFAERKETRHELAEMADVSHTTLDKAEYIVNNADDETNEKLRNGEKGTSINKEYTRLKAEAAKPAEAVEPIEPAHVEKADPGEAVDTTQFIKSMLYDPNEPQKISMKFTITSYDPVDILGSLSERIRKGYLEDLVVCAMAHIEEYKGKQVAKEILEKIKKQFGTFSKKTRTKKEN